MSECHRQGRLLILIINSAGTDGGFVMEGMQQFVQLLRDVILVGFNDDATV